MCFETIPVLFNHAIKTHADGNVILLTYARSLHLLLPPLLSLWVFGIVSQLSTKLTSFLLFPYIHSQHLGLDWDLDSSRRLRYPGCSLSQLLFLSHQGKLAGVGALVCSFQTIGNTQPLSPGQSQLIWISCNYCNGSYKTPDSSNLSSPGQILATFLEELDGLLSSFMEDGTPLLVFGDFNIHLDRPYATDFHSLLASFDLKRLTTTSTHKSGNQLDLIYTRNCTTDNILVQPLHISDHFFITFTLHFTTQVPPAPLPVTFRRNLRSLSPTLLSSVVSSSLPSPTHFTSLDVNAATDTLCSTLTSCLDDICPLSSRPARAAPSNPGYPMFFVSIGPNSERQRENGANQMIRRTWLGISLCFRLSLLKSTLPNPHTSTTRSTALQTCVISSEHLILSSVPLHHRPPLL